MKFDWGKIQSADYGSTDPSSFILEHSSVKLLLVALDVRALFRGVWVVNGSPPTDAEWDDIQEFVSNTMEELFAMGILAIEGGGTGADNAADARENLGLVAGGAGDIWVEKAGDIMTGELLVDTVIRIAAPATGNLAVGEAALEDNTTGDYNLALGYQAGNSNTEGSDNVFLGRRAGYLNIGGWANTFLGSEAGYFNDEGIANIFLGSKAGFGNTTGTGNAFLGYQAGYLNTTGGYNLSLGFNAGFSNLTGGYNVFLGHKAGYNETGSNKLYISHSDTATPLIYGEFDNALLEFNATKMGFYDASAIVKPAALTTALTQITHTGPVTPDYAIATPIDSDVASAWGFSTQDELETIMSVVQNLQARVDELETKLQGLGLLT